MNRWILLCLGASAAACIGPTATEETSFAGDDLSASGKADETEADLPSYPSASYADLENWRDNRKEAFAAPHFAVLGVQPCDEIVTRQFAHPYGVQVMTLEGADSVDVRVPARARLEFAVYDAGGRIVQHRSTLGLERENHYISLPSADPYHLVVHAAPQVGGALDETLRSYEVELSCR